jgi:hypothetical protein
MERDDLAPTHPLAADDGVTRHVMVGFSDPAVRSLPSKRAQAARGHLSAAPRMAPDAGDGIGRSHESLDETRAVVRLDRRCHRCDHGSGGGDRRLHGAMVGFSLTPQPSL